MGTNVMRLQSGQRGLAIYLAFLRPTVGCARFLKSQYPQTSVWQFAGDFTAATSKNLHASKIPRLNAVSAFLATVSCEDALNEIEHNIGPRPFDRVNTRLHATALSNR